MLKASYYPAYFRSGPKHQTNGPIILHLSEQVSSLNKASIIRALAEVPRDAQVVVNGSDSLSVDYGVREAIENFRQVAPERGIKSGQVMSH